MDKKELALIGCQLDFHGRISLIPEAPGTEKMPNAKDIKYQLLKYFLVWYTKCDVS